MGSKAFAGREKTPLMAVANAMRRPHLAPIGVLVAWVVLGLVGAGRATEAGVSPTSTGSSGVPEAGAKSEAKTADAAKTDETEKSGAEKTEHTDKTEQAGEGEAEKTGKGGEDPGSQRYQGPPPPPMGMRFRLDRHIFDTTGSLSATDLSGIQSLCEEHYRLDGYPVAVVVLNYLSETGDSSGSLEEVGLQLLGQLQAGRKNPDYAVVLIVALKDEALRVQKGVGWGDRYDKSVQEIIDQVIIPKLKRHDREGNELQVDVASAIRAGVAGLVSVLHQGHVADQPLFVPLGRFLAQSWIWILLALHLLGLLYVMITKESEAWYVAGFLFGLPILLGMLCWMLGGRGDGSEAETGEGHVFRAGSMERAALRSGTWINW